MKFLDQAKIYLQSGDGGAGCVAFRREKFIEYGGPDGGNGGKGGNVIFECAANLNTLIDFRYRQHFKAERGHHGMGENRSGAAGKDVIVRVPVGTQVLDEDNDTVLFDFTQPGQRMTVLEGGDGGFGNAHFKSSTNRAPRHAGPGWSGKEMWVWLRLKLIADAGLVGLPNAGKSTFLAAVTRARPKIAAYPFTTLHPNLGVAHVGEEEFVIADIPGLIEGAHEGAGLGDRFLGHVERCAVLLHLIDGTEEDVAAAYKIVRGELTGYGHGLARKAELVALNKCDALDEDTIRAKCAALAKASRKEKVFAISGVSGQGLPQLLAALWEYVAQARLHRDAPAPSRKARKVRKPKAAAPKASAAKPAQKSRKAKAAAKPVKAKTAKSKTTAKRTAPKKAAPQKAAPKKTAKTKPVKTTPKKIAPKKAVAKKAVAKKAAPKKATKSRTRKARA